MGLSYVQETPNIMGLSYVFSIMGLSYVQLVWYMRPLILWDFLMYRLSIMGLSYVQRFPNIMGVSYVQLVFNSFLKSTLPQLTQ